MWQRSKFWTHFARISHVITHIGDHVSCAKTASKLLCLASPSRPPLPPARPTPYDGLWNVTVVTKSGSCEPSTSSTLTVTDGKVSAAGAELPAASDAKALCVSRSMVHMQTANSMATPDRGNGMGHQRAYLQRSMGSVTAVTQSASRTRSRVIKAAAPRRCRRSLLAILSAPPATRNQTRSWVWPAVGPARRWSRLRMDRQNASVAAPPTRSAGARTNQTLACASDSYRFDLKANVISERGELSGTWSESSRGLRAT